MLKCCLQSMLSYRYLILRHFSSLCCIMYYSGINDQYPCKMSDGKNKRPLDIPFVKWIWKCPLVFHVSIGSNGQVEFPWDICFFSWSITMYLNDVMTSPCRYCAIEIAKRKCPLDPMDPMDLEMSIGILFVHWIQWTSGISIGHLLFQLVNYHVFE